MRIAVVIPCYRVRRQILDVIGAIPAEVESIYVVDDACPEESGRLVEARCKDPRVKVLYHQDNRGVGGAVITGYQAAAYDGAEIIVKIDGDGQMDPALIGRFVKPIEAGLADYTKGNRFYAPETVAGMPRLRLFGNAALSFVTKATSGYWDLMDPTNGYTAIHSSVLPLMPLDKIDRRYFFESDMLFRLNIIRAVVLEVPMRAVYASEQSSLRIGRVLLEFPLKHGFRFFKRIFYNYFLRDFNACSLELVLGSLLMAAGSVFGIYHWISSGLAGVEASTGTVMIAALPVILGFQLLLAALHFDISNIPHQPLSRLLGAQSAAALRETPLFKKTG